MSPTCVAAVIAGTVTRPTGALGLVRITAVPPTVDSVERPTMFLAVTLA